VEATKDRTEAQDAEQPEAESASGSSAGSADSILMWTAAYRPFRMGGNVNQPVGIEVTVGEPIPLDHGISVYVVVTPDGRKAIVEAMSGGIVGTSLEQVKRDIEDADPAMMRDQIVRACEQRKEVDILDDPDEFYGIWVAE